VHPKTTYQFIFTSSLVNDFYKKVTLIQEDRFVKCDEYVVSGLHGFYLRFRILINEIVVFRIVNLTLNSKAIFDFRQVAYVNFIEKNRSSVSYAFFENLFEIEDVSHLTRLSYSSSMFESFPAIVSDCILCGICKSTKHKITTYQCSCSSFTRITMNDNDILFITL
jgi:hypothetical protein